MSKKTNILFISWDSGDTTYLETLFFPIFSEIQNNSPYRFFCIQFTWAEQPTIQHRKQIAEDVGIHYEAVHLKNTLRNKVSNILKSRKLLAAFCQQHPIDYLMPRSVWPALICLNSQLKLPIIYDADGLVYLEKKEYGSPRLLTYLIDKVEKNIIIKSQLIFTRAIYAKEWYQKKYTKQPLPPFQSVPNGVSSEQFFFDENLRNETRKSLGLKETDFLFVYVGSLGKKYNIERAISVFQAFYQKHPNARFIILSGHTQKAALAMTKDKTDAVQLKKVPHQDINAYLNAADAGFCFIQTSDAIKAVNPIKLNEYLMTGLPVLINRGIGDTETWLKAGENCVFMDDESISDDIIQNIQALKNNSRAMISEKATEFCSLIMAANTYISAFNKHLS